MERVVVLGPGGAGKTHVALALARATGSPVVHLDRLFWRPGWELAPEEESRPAVAEAVAADRWILDGNFLGLGADDPRFARADTIVFLDLPRVLCVRRALVRVVRERGRRRRDLPEGCDERVDLPFLRWIWRYPRDVRPRVLAILAGMPPEVEVVHLRTRTAVRSYLRSLSQQSTQRGS
jgi:adenylate kinase family enzyme